jgi:outer membrane immunogenic protein
LSSDFAHLLVNPPAFFGTGTALGPASFQSIRVIGGLQVGYNWQVSPLWVAGFEADFNWSGVKGGGQTSNAILQGEVNQIITADRDIQWFGTLRGRVGIVPIPNALFYGTAGFAYARVGENVNEFLNSPLSFVGGRGFVGFQVGNSGFSCVYPARCMAGASSRTATGWTAGGGGEFAVAPNISVKAEYLYVRLSGDDFSAVAFSALAVSGAPVPASIRASYDAVNLHTAPMLFTHRAAHLRHSRLSSSASRNGRTAAWR